MLKQPIYYEFNLDARTSPSKLIAISHVDDKYSEVLEVAVKQNDRFVYMGGATVIARMVLHRDKDYLLSDDVTCSVNSNGNILIPFDNAVVKTLQGVVKIEVNITRDADELTLQFPLWVSVNGSILDNAEVTPESRGTVPDLLREAAAQLSRVKDFATEDFVFENLDAALQGNPHTAPSLFVMQDAETDNYKLVYMDSNDNLHVLFDFGLLPVAKGEKGDKGDTGADGYSPTVSTTNLDAQTLVTVTDKNGAHNFYVKDGSSVTNAAVDENGDLIISIQQKPTSSVHPTIHTLEVNAGHVVGAAGAKGDKGDKGDTGNDYVLTPQDKTDIAGMVDISGKADKATTLAGYGITDAYTKTQTDTFFSDTNADIADIADALLGINAGSVGFDETGTYADGSIGAVVSNQKNALNFTNQGALDYALNYDIDLFKFLKWTKGQYVDNSNGNILNNSRFYISDPIEVSDLKSGYLHLVITNSFTFKYAQYDANGDFLLGGSYGSAVDRVLSIRDTCKTIRFSVGAWSGTYTLSDYLNAITIYVKPAHNVVIEDYIGYEELDFLYDKYIVTPSVSTANVSTTPVSFDQCVCLSTPCTKGQIFTITGTPRDNTGSRPVMFLDQANTCIYRSAEASAFNNVEITAPVTGTLVVNFLKAYPFQCYTGFKNLSEKIFKNLDSVNTIKSFPVDIIPDWLTNAMAIRTVGPLQKGYICLTCDDGATELESYTIPMLLNKQVPCTFGLWASTSKVGAAHPFNKSPVLQTPSGIAAVKNAITAGCSVAQHGPLEWTDMTNEFLNEFFDREAAAWEALEIDVKGAICPSHCINNAVRVTAGGRFGVVRAGYRGYLSKADQQAVINGDVFAEYNYYCAGPRSNVFGLSSFNTNAVTLSWMKGAVDYATAQKMILVVYWHDWDLTAEQKSDLEAFIDYAKAQNITFCTLGEIPFLA